jgi:hypothetical protein
MQTILKRTPPSTLAYALFLLLLAFALLASRNP